MLSYLMQNKTIRGVVSGLTLLVSKELSAQEEPFDVPNIRGGYHVAESLVEFHSVGYPGYRDIEEIKNGDLTCEIKEVRDKSKTNVSGTNVVIRVGYHKRKGQPEREMHRQEITYDKNEWPIRVTTWRADTDEQSPVKISDYLLLRLPSTDPKFPNFVKYEAHDDKNGVNGRIDSSAFISFSCSVIVRMSICKCFVWDFFA